MGAGKKNKYNTSFKASFQRCDIGTHYSVFVFCLLKASSSDENVILILVLFFFFGVLPHTFHLLLCQGTLLFSCRFECTTRCCLCHNVFLITIPEVRCQQAASNPICITRFPSSLLNSWEDRGHQSLLTSRAVKHFQQQLLGPSQPLFLCNGAKRGFTLPGSDSPVLHTNHLVSSKYH